MHYKKRQVKYLSLNIDLLIGANWFTISRKPTETPATMNMTSSSDQSLSTDLKSLYRVFARNKKLMYPARQLTKPIRKSNSDARILFTVVVTSPGI